MHKKLFLTAALIACSPAAPALDENTTGPDPVTVIEAGHQVVQALIWNPEIAERLKQEHLDHVYRMTRQEVEPGITRYVINVSSCGNCQPRQGTVEIIEDMRPTYADGPIDYEISITVDD